MSNKHDNTKHVCLSCGSGDWYENEAFRDLPRVTSDSVLLLRMAGYAFACNAG